MKFGYVFAKRLGTTLKKFLYNRSKRFANMTQTFFHKRGSQKLEENLKKFKWFYSWVHLYGYCVHSPYPFFLSSFLPVSAFFNFFPARGPPPPPPLRMWPQPFSLTLYRICMRTQENCGKPVPIQSAIPQRLSTVYNLWKNGLLLSVSKCRSQTGGHPSKYRPSARLLDLGDRLVPDTYHTPNFVGYFWEILICNGWFFKRFLSHQEVYEILSESHFWLEM